MASKVTSKFGSALHGKTGEIHLDGGGVIMHGIFTFEVRAYPDGTFHITACSEPVSVPDGIIFPGNHLPQWVSDLIEIHPDQSLAAFRCVSESQSGWK